MNVFMPHSVHSSLVLAVHSIRVITFTFAHSFRISVHAVTVNWRVTVKFWYHCIISKCHVSAGLYLGYPNNATGYFTIHTSGSNSTATFGSSAGGLIAFAGFFWIFIVTELVELCYLVWYRRNSGSK